MCNIVCSEIYQLDVQFLEVFFYVHVCNGKVVSACTVLLGLASHVLGGAKDSYHCVKMGKRKKNKTGLRFRVYKAKRERKVGQCQVPKVSRF